MILLNSTTRRSCPQVILTLARYSGRSEPDSQNVVERRDSAVIKEKASGAGRCCHLPHARRRTRQRSRRLRSRFRLLHEKAAGRSCRRRARPDLHIATGAAAFARGSLGPGAHAQRRACHPSTDLRSQHDLARKRGPASPGPHMTTDRSAGATPQPPWNRKASLDEKDLAFRLDDRGGSDVLATLEATDAGRPALGRAAAARELALPRSCLQAGPGRKRGPTLSRTGESVSPVLAPDNHALLRDRRISCE